MHPAGLLIIILHLKVLNHVGLHRNELNLAGLHYTHIHYTLYFTIHYIYYTLSFTIHYIYYTLYTIHYSLLGNVMLVEKRKIYTNCPFFCTLIVSLPCLRGGYLA